MNKSSNASAGRILRHGQRADAITDESIEKRARELAAIDGRNDDDVTPRDRESALAELLGRHLPEGSFDDGESEETLSRDPSEPRSIPGQRTPTYNEPEDQEMQERMVLEGVEEAQHDQMLADRHRRHSGV
jgi:hypothetical protein